MVNPPSFKMTKQDNIKWIVVVLFNLASGVTPDYDAMSVIEIIVDYEPYREAAVKQYLREEKEMGGRLMTVAQANALFDKLYNL